jgi:hypothetical protein
MGWFDGVRGADPRLTGNLNGIVVTSPLLPNFPNKMAGETYFFTMGSNMNLDFVSVTQ